MPGFPIRTSSDPRSVDSSPRHIAASHVLHRLPVPRHPPCALKHLQHKTKKMSHPHTPHTPKEAQHACEYQKNLHYIKDPQQKLCVFDARNHYPQIKHHTPPPKQGNNEASHHTQWPGKHGPVVSKPNSVSDDFAPQPRKTRIPLQHLMFVMCTRPGSTTETRPSSRIDQGHRTPTRCGRA